MKEGAGPRRPEGERPPPDEELKKRKRNRRKDGDRPEDAEPEEARVRAPEKAPKDEEPEAERNKPTEAEVRAAAAEAAFQRRVELAELRAGFSDEEYEALKRQVGSEGAWIYEEGKVSLRSIAAEVPVESGPIRKLVVRVGTSRDETPKEVSEIRRDVERAVKGPAGMDVMAERLESVSESLPDQQTVELIVDTPTGGSALVSIDREAVRVHETDSPDSPVVQERKVAISELAAAERIDALPINQQMKLANKDAQESLAEIAAEPGPSKSPFGRLISKAERVWAENNLSEIQGGAPEEDEAVLADVPTEEPGDVSEELREELEEMERPEEPVQDPIAEAIQRQREARVRPRRRRAQLPPPPLSRLPEIGRRGGGETIPPLPDAETRRAARRMLRKLAARFGLRLTPDLEGYLMQIVFRLRFMGGRLRRGIGVNMDILLRIMGTLREHYPVYQRGGS